MHISPSSSSIKEIRWACGWPVAAGKREVCNKGKRKEKDKEKRTRKVGEWIKKKKKDKEGRRIDKKKTQRK